MLVCLVICHIFLTRNNSNDFIFDPKLLIDVYLRKGFSDFWVIIYFLFVKTLIFFLWQFSKVWYHLLNLPFLDINTKSNLGFKADRLNCPCISLWLVKLCCSQVKCQLIRFIPCQFRKYIWPFFLFLKIKIHLKCVFVAKLLFKDCISVITHIL